jgi:uncharacterized protein
MSKASYVIRLNAAGEHYFVLRATNNEPILTSESYTAAHNAEKGVEAARINAPHDDRYQRLTSTRGEPYFALCAANHEILGTSEMYSSDAKRDEGIEAVKKHAPVAVVIER